MQFLESLQAYVSVPLQLVHKSHFHTNRKLHVSVWCRERTKPISPE